MTDTVARCVPLDRPGSTPNLRHALSGPAPVSAPVSQAHLFRANRRLFHLHSPGTQILKSVQLAVSGDNGDLSVETGFRHTKIGLRV